MNKNLVKKLAGFTLLEVMIALAIVALTMGAAVRASSVAIDSHSHLRERTIGLWLAKNRMAQIRATGELLDTGDHSSEKKMNGLFFTVKESVTDTFNSKIRRVEVKVYSSLSDDRYIANLTGYISYE